MDGTLRAILLATGIFFAVTLVLVVIFFALSEECERPNLLLLIRNFVCARTARKPKLSSIKSKLSSIVIDESATFDASLSQISMPDLVRATRNFSPDLVIGDGAFGLVYKADLPSNGGVTVAVKRLSSEAIQGLRQFVAEIETLGKIRHPNIVTILGYCASGSERVLIYEFIEKGSLDQWLLDLDLDTSWSWSSSISGSSRSTSSSLPRLPLSWETRLKITRGVATGLTYMHNLEAPIIHRDIKASNVLLDTGFEAHIADFGIARTIEGSRSHVSTQAAGSIGYRPPEYMQGATRATLMGDVYSFGVLMLVIATGIRPDLPLKDVNRKEVSFVELARKRVAVGRHMELLDVRISREGLKESEVVEFFRVAMMCTDDIAKNRPVMKVVLEMLNRITS